MTARALEREGKEKKENRIHYMYIEIHILHIEATNGTLTVQ